jgi:hypothetical protein
MYVRFIGAFLKEFADHMQLSASVLRVKFVGGWGQLVARIAGRVRNEGSLTRRKEKEEWVGLCRERERKWEGWRNKEECRGMKGIWNDKGREGEEACKTCRKKQAGTEMKGGHVGTWMKGRQAGTKREGQEH